MDTIKLLSQRVYTWGANSYGQLGQGNCEDLLEPQSVDNTLPIGDVRSLVGGGGHSVLLTEAGELFVCGQNHKGQLGLGHAIDVTSFHLCALPVQKAVHQVSCGWDFTLILTDDGQVLSCGSNAYGQLGLPHIAGHAAEPLHIQTLTEPVISVAAGLRHSLAVTGSGHVYQWGTGLSSQAKRALSPHPVPAHLVSMEPCPVPGLDHVTPCKVAAGASHCVCLTAAGDLFVWGSNKQGQLGNTGTFIPQPMLLDCTVMGGETVTEIWSGWTHLVAKTDSGRVFSWGRSNYGQLGRPVLGSQSSRLESGNPTAEDSILLACIPVEVKTLSGVTQIACGSEHNLAIVGGCLLSWGWNEHGMCGDGSTTDITQPQPIPALRDARPLLIGCGAGHSMALCLVSGNQAKHPQESTTSPEKRTFPTKD
ncbi:secretion-regulating guanine nucleotide exchange factor isoform X1 [Megalops cyprinoides]|uniref:secretion-regulating guanine nucleotide exchange factor isoform X1 n=1 Tax=Megalops cyprinoides TaxID=118141 RepID=UPI001865396D|nr:secretion-regulating guanine nucleotide exchange factor isoform X1 [Megalops cyprinoides]